MHQIKWLIVFLVQYTPGARGSRLAVQDGTKLVVLACKVELRSDCLLAGYSGEILRRGLAGGLLETSVKRRL